MKSVHPMRMRAREWSFCLFGFRVTVERVESDVERDDIPRYRLTREGKFIPDNELGRCIEKQLRNDALQTATSAEVDAGA